MHINQIFRPRKAGKTQSGDEKLMFVEIIKRAAIIIIVRELQ